MTRQEAIWHANHVFNLVIERCINAQNLKEAREFDEAKQIVIEALEQDRPTAHWKDGKWCSNCGEGIPTDVYGGGITEEEAHFCISCGARMESDTE